MTTPNGSQPGPQPQWTPKTWHELQNMPAKTWLIDRFLGRGDVGMIYSQPGSGKTFVAIDLTMCCIQGIDWIGSYSPVVGWEGRRAIPDALDVLYVSDEGVRGLGQRFRAAADEYAVPPAVLADRLTWLSDMPNFAPKAVGGAAGADAFIQQLLYRRQAGHPVDLVVVDTFANAASGVDENDNGMMHQVMGRFRQLARQLDCAVLLLHHTGKSGIDYRGASSVRGSLDCLCKISGSGGTFVLENERLKDGELWQPAQFTLTKRGDSAVVLWDSVTAGSKTAAAPTVQTQVFDLLKQYPADRFTAKDIAGGIGARETAVQNALGRLAADGRVERIQSQTGSRTRFEWQLGSALRAAMTAVSP